MTRKKKRDSQSPAEQYGIRNACTLSPELWGVGISIQNPDSTPPPAVLLACPNNHQAISKKKTKHHTKKKTQPRNPPHQQPKLEPDVSLFLLKQKQEKTKKKKNYNPPRVNQSHSSPFLLFYPMHLPYPALPCLTPLSKPNPAQTTFTPHLPTHPSIQSLILSTINTGEGWLKIPFHFPFLLI